MSVERVEGGGVAVATATGHRGFVLSFAFSGGWDGPAALHRRLLPNDGGQSGS